MDLQLQDRVAIIAGASRGIGRAIATTLAAEGCNLLLTARGEAALAETAAELSGSVATIDTLAGDISDPDFASVAVERVQSRFSGLDIYIGNAGGNRRKPFTDTTDADWKEIMELNFMAHARFSRACIPLMRANEGGSIIFISSIFGRETGGAGLSIYNTTKTALISLAGVMALELAPDGIRVNTVAPGSIRFPGGSWDKRCVQDPDGMSTFIEQNLPMGRFGKASEVADVVTFLSSPRASWVSGACITVDGVQSRSLI